MNLLVTAPSPPSASGLRCLVLSLVLAACATSAGIAAAPTAVGQATPAPLTVGISHFPIGERDARDCDRRIEPEGSAPFLRTELYFGSSKPDGSVITLEQFQHFLDQEITPRFPDGLTLLTGLGQSQCAEDRGNSLYLQAAVPTRIGAASG
jgi:hypothetical protein